MSNQNIVQNGRGSFTATQQELFDKSTLKPISKIVTLKMEKPRRKGGNAPDFKIGGYMHPELRVWVGIPKRLNPDGTYEFSKIRFNGVHTFDLSNPTELYHHFIITNSPFFKGSKMQILSGNDKNLIIEHDPEKEAEQTIAKRAIAHTMEGEIMNWSEDKIKDFGTLYKINPKANSVVAIKAMLLNKLNNNPQEMQEFHNQYETRSQFLIELRKAQFANLLTIDPTKGWLYRDTLLGSNESTAVDRLKRDLNLFQILKADVEQSLPGSTVRSISEKSFRDKEQERKDIIGGPQPQVDVKAAINEALADFKNHIMQEYDLVPKGQAKQEQKPEEPEDDFSGFEEEGVAVAAEPATKKTSSKKKA